jgi:ribosomal protein L23
MATKKTTKEEGKVEAKFIIAPRITEKASAQSSHNAFTFVVKESATKRAIVEEIKKGNIDKALRFIFDNFKSSLNSLP